MAAAPTPAVGVLIKAKITYVLHPYEHDRTATAFGAEAVAALGQNPARVFKTLMASVDGTLVVGVVPVAGHLDLKALAAAVGGKKGVMAPVVEAEKSSGYVAGGISPIGQRRPRLTVVDRSVTDFDTVFVSAGRRGLELEIHPMDLISVCGALLASISAV